MTNQSIVPHFLLDGRASKHAEYYVSVFPESKITSQVQLPEAVAGDCDVATFELLGHQFMAIGMSPETKPNPAVSFMMNFRDPDSLKDSWEKLSGEGKILMPLDKYPFCPLYGWVEDRNGMSWQLLLSAPDATNVPTVIPSLLFIGDQFGKAESAINFYVTSFKKSKIKTMMKNEPTQENPNASGIIFADFLLEDECFAAMDSGNNDQFVFSDATSFVVLCEDQQTIDHYWEKLSTDSSGGRCGWLKDKFGLTWQIVPRSFSEMMTQGTEEQRTRMLQALSPMKKIELKTIEDAYSK